MENINKIDKNAHYFVLMHPLEVFETPILTIAFTSSNTREKWVECVVVEERYKLEENYKIELRSIEEGYGKETYYIEDFLSLLESGCIVKKEENMECEEEEWLERLDDNNYLHHSAYVLKQKPSKKKLK
jgi:hypothetical protein